MYSVILASGINMFSKYIDVYSVILASGINMFQKYRCV